MERDGDPSAHLTLADFRRAVPGERRRDFRFPCERRVEILSCGGRRWSLWNVPLVNYSSRGVGLLVEVAMKPDDRFLARLRLDTMRTVVYTVRHCTPATGKGFIAGAEFSGVLGSPRCDPAEVLDALLSASA